MRKLFLLILNLILGTIICLGQIDIIDGNYRTFDGRDIQVYQIEGEYCVLNIDTSIISNDQLSDTTTLINILNRCDQFYSFYERNVGFVPSGGNPNFDNKTNVFFGSPSCGAGCGLVGGRGVEVSQFEKIYFNLKYNNNVNRDAIIAYELGRNFFTFSDKFLFPFTVGTEEKNGGFAEGFATTMVYYAYDEILKGEQRDLNEILLNKRWGLQMFHGYINDTTATPYNTIALWEKLGTLDPNRGIDGANTFDPAYNGASYLFGIYETFDHTNLFPKFFEILRSRPSVTTIEDALSNIAYSTSFALEQNLVPFFKNVMRFKLNSDVEAEIEALPLGDNRLIRDEQLLWFISPFETINLNLRSINHLADNYEYQIIVDGEVFSRNETGNNVLDYSILNNEDEKLITCQLIINDAVIDSYDILLKKRHNINLLDYKDDFYAHSYMNEKSKSSFKGDTLVIESIVGNDLSRSEIFYNLVNSHDRLFRLEGDIRNVSMKYDPADNITIDGLPTTGYSAFGLKSIFRVNGIPQRVGYDIGVNDSTTFYNMTFEDSSSFFLIDERDYFMNKVYISNSGYGQKTEITNLYYYDITDTDGDGFIDFEDECPSVYGEENGCPKSSSVDNFNQSVIKVYPNPVTDDIIKIEVLNQNSCAADFYDFSGRKAKSIELRSGLNEICIDDLKTGIYFIRITENYNSILTYKFVKE